MTVYRILVRHGLIDAKKRRRDGRTTRAGNGTRRWRCGSSEVWGAPDIHVAVVAADGCAGGG